VGRFRAPLRQWTCDQKSPRLRNAARTRIHPPFHLSSFLTVSTSHSSKPPNPQQRRAHWRPLHLLDRSCCFWTAFRRPANETESAVRGRKLGARNSPEVKRRAGGGFVTRLTRSPPPTCRVLCHGRGSASVLRMPEAPLCSGPKWRGSSARCSATLGSNSPLQTRSAAAARRLQTPMLDRALPAEIPSSAGRPPHSARAARPRNGTGLGARRHSEPGRAAGGSGRLLAFFFFYIFCHRRAPTGLLDFDPPLGPRSRQGLKINELCCRS
jgi:hypothetical protein